MDVVKEKQAALFDAASTMVSRAALAARLGFQYGGERDMFTALGYIANPTYADFALMYDREGLAAAVADAYPTETWRRHPVILDGDARSDNPKGGNAFINAWRELVTRVPVMRELRTLDINTNLGRYAVLYLGFGEQSEEPTALGEPIERAASLEFLMAFGEGEAPIEKFFDDVNDRSFGLPELYKLALHEQSRTIHSTRTIHAAESRRGSRVYGRPRLKLAINRLFDIEKTVGGAAEALWMVMNRGLGLAAQEGQKMPTAESPEGKALQEEIDNYVNKLQRVLRTKGIDITELGGGGGDVEPKETFDIAISYLAGTLGIPKRILIGSERGELASTQDDINWADKVTDRQLNYAEPDILRPFIDRLIALGVLPKPTGGVYQVEWPSLFSLNDVEHSEVAMNVAKAMRDATAGVPEQIMEPEEFARIYLDYVAEVQNA